MFSTYNLRVETTFSLIKEKAMEKVNEKGSFSAKQLSKSQVRFVNLHTWINEYEWNEFWFSQLYFIAWDKHYINIYII